MRCSLLVACLGLTMALGLVNRASADPVVVDLGDLAEELGLDLESLTFPELMTFTQVQWGDNILTPENLFSDEGVAASSTTNGFANGGNFEGTASATASFNELGVFASAVATDSPYLVNAASGFALFTDSITINGGTPGADGTTTFSFDVDGTTTTDGAAGVVASLYVVQTSQGGTSLLDGVLIFTEDDFQYETGEFPIIFGEAFDLTVIFGVTGLVSGGIIGNGTGTATGAFNETVTLTGIDTFEEGGPVSTTIERASEASVIPEPSSLALLCIGTIALIGAQWRGRRRGV